MYLRILIIEDEFSLADVIQTYLKKEKYIVDIASDGEIGLYNALTDIYDLIILDIMLPKINGFDILRKIKDANIHSKVIILTAKSLLEDKLEGLENGANDYVTKPFHIEELMARINIQLRDNKKILKDYIEAGDIRLNIKNSNLICKTTNEQINVICKEFQLLELFINNPNQIISKEQIYDRIWGINNESTSNNLEAYLSFIRKKLKIIGAKVNIKSIRGLGYKLEINDEEIKN